MRRIPYWAMRFMKMLKNDVDVSIIITGPKGYGKSTLTIWLMLWTEAYFHDGVAEVEPVLQSLTWDPAEWMSKMNESYRYRAVGFEEFGNATTVEQVNDIINQLIRKAQSSNRFLNILKVFNVPGFVHVPPKVRNTMNFWINVTAKGRGVMYHVYPEEGPDQRPMKFYKTNLGGIKYDALPPEIYQVYKRVKREVELRNYKQNAAKMEDVKFKQLPTIERKKILAKHIIEMKDKDIVTMNNRSNVPALKWGIVAAELAVRYGISVSVNTLKRYFAEIFAAKGWEGIEEIANL